MAGLGLVATLAFSLLLPTARRFEARPFRLRVQAAAVGDHLRTPWWRHCSFWRVCSARGPRRNSGRNSGRFSSQRRRSAFDRRQHQLIDEAPAPVLARLGRGHHRMIGGLEMLGCVPFRRAVAAADMATIQALAQVHPLGAVPQALLATLGGWVFKASSPSRWSHATPSPRSGST